MWRRRKWPMLLKSRVNARNCPQYQMDKYLSRPADRPSSNMRGIKRSNSVIGAEQLESLPCKVTKTSHPEEAQAAVDNVSQIMELQAQIAGLGSHIEEFHKLLLEDDVLFSNFPQSIQEYVYNYPATPTVFGRVIREKIDATYDRCAYDEQISSAKMSSRMNEHVKEVVKLSEMVGATRLAFELILYLGAHSYKSDTEAFKRKMGSSYSYHRYRSSDPSSDRLLLKLAKRLRQEDRDFMPVHEYESLKSERETVKKLGFDSYFRKSLDFFWSWIEGPAVMQNFHDQLKIDITKASTDISETEETYYRAASAIDTFQSELNKFLPSISKLSDISLDGLGLAVDLLLYTGRHSYDMKVLEAASVGSDGPGGGYVIANDNIDNLLCKLLDTVKIADPGKLQAYLDHLTEERRFLADYNVISYFPKSYEWLLLQFPDASATYAMSFYEEIKTKVDSARKMLEKRLEISKVRGVRPTTDWFGTKMKTFLPEVEGLSCKPGGTKPAIKLLFYLGYCASPRVPGIDLLFHWEPTDNTTIKRTFDEDADKLGLQLLSKARKEDENYDPVNELNVLKSEAVQLLDLGVTTYFTDCMAYMLGGCKEVMPVTEETQLSDSDD